MNQTIMYGTDECLLKINLHNKYDKAVREKERRGNKRVYGKYIINRIYNSLIENIIWINCDW